MPTRQKVKEPPKADENLNHILIPLSDLRLALAKLSKEGYTVLGLGDLLVLIWEVKREAEDD